MSCVKSELVKRDLEDDDSFNCFLLSVSIHDHTDLFVNLDFSFLNPADEMIKSSHWNCPCAAVPETSQICEIKQRYCNRTAP